MCIWSLGLSVNYVMQSTKCISRYSLSSGPQNHKTFLKLTFNATFCYIIVNIPAKLLLNSSIHYELRVRTNNSLTTIVIWLYSASKLTFDLHFLYNDVSLGFQISAVLLDDFICTENDVWGNRENPVFDWMNLIRAKK